MDWLNTLLRCGVKTSTAARWISAFNTVATPDRFSLGSEEMDDWLSQVLHESAMLERTVENLNYSAPRMMAVWPRRFPTLASAQPFAFKPEALANYVYGGRMGNTQPGDGWRCIGRGLIMVTGADAYRKLGAAMGLPLYEQPELLEQRDIALKAAIVWWEGNVPDAFEGQPVKIRQAVNGGTIGLDDTTRLAKLADGDGDGRIS